MVDDLRWLTAAGAPLDAVDAAHAGSELIAQVRFFSALPLTGVLHATVRADLPGLDTDADPVVGTASVALDIDPLAYAVTSRDVLNVPFTATVAGALGFTLELTLDDDPRPLFTTNWDRIWTVGALDFDRPMYRDDYGTYGHWPPSLPIAAPDVSTATLFAKAVRYPAGAGIPDVAVDLDDGARTAVTAAAGASVFGDVAPGPHTVALSAAGFAPVDPVTVDVANLATAWAVVPLHAIPAVTTTAPYTTDTACAPFAIDRAPFGDQLKGFEVEARRDDDDQRLGGPLAVGKIGQGEVCYDAAAADGDAVHLVARARYVDDTLGVEGASATFVVDASAPEATAVAAADGDAACVPDDLTLAPGAALLAATTLTVTASDAHSGVAEVALVHRSGDRSTLLEARPSSPTEPSVEASFTIAPASFGSVDALEVRVTNGAGLVRVVDVPRAALPLVADAPACPGEIEDDVVEAPEDVAAGEADASAEAEPPRRRGDDGCQGGSTGGLAPLLGALGLLGVRARRRRRGLTA